MTEAFNKLNDVVQNKTIFLITVITLRFLDLVLMGIISFFFKFGYYKTFLACVLAYYTVRLLYYVYLKNNTTENAKENLIMDSLIFVLVLAAVIRTPVWLIVFYKMIPAFFYLFLYGVFYFSYHYEMFKLNKIKSGLFNLKNIQVIINQNVTNAYKQIPYLIKYNINVIINNRLYKKIVENKKFIEIYMRVTQLSNELKVFFFDKIEILLDFNYIFKYKIKYTYDLVFYFFKKYIFTINHKRIALNYLYFCFFSAMTGLFLATIIRIELSVPGSFFFKGDSTKYLQVITSHGLIMVFFVVTPVLFGFIGNFFIPYHIGSKDVAFPRLNSLGFWILFCGFVVLAKPAALRRQLFKYYDKSSDYYYFLNYKRLGERTKLALFNTDNKKEIVMNYRIFNNNINETVWYFFFNDNTFLKNKSTFVVQCNNSSLTMAGWTFITPFSSKTKFTGFGSQDIATIAVIFAGVSTTISFVNLLITRRTLSMPGLRNRKILMPFISINLFLTMRMLSMIIPVLGAAMIMLQLDRHFGFSFFDYSYGGDPVLFHHLFWFFGHPEVYVVIIPAFGIISMILPFFNFRRIAAKNHLIWATYIMAYMGFLVWGHHMYLIGLDHRSRAMYSTITVMISLPAIVKIVNWTLTLLNGSFLIETPIIFAFSFLLFFLCGGLTGMWLSHVGLNVYVHDTFYIVAHFHFMFSASTFSAIFTCIYYYFWQIFGVKYSEYLSYLHLFYWFCGQWLTFLPIFWIGYNGCPRRYHDYPLIFANWNSISSYGHILTIISVIIFFFMILDSFLIKNTFTNFNLNIPRWHKRINYYLFKISYIQKYNKNIKNYKFMFVCV